MTPQGRWPGSRAERQVHHGRRGQRSRDRFSLRRTSNRGHSHRSQGPWPSGSWSSFLGPRLHTSGPRSSGFTVLASLFANKHVSTGQHHRHKWPKMGRTGCS